MRCPKFSVYDFFFLLAYLILNFYLVRNYESFKQCAHPLHQWLLIDYNLLLVIRILFVIKSSNYGRIFIQIVSFLFYGLAMPSVIGWSVVGVLWHTTTDIECIPEDMVPWSFTLWLGITIITALTVFILAVVDLREQIQLNSLMKRVEADSVRSRTNASLLP